MTIIQWGGQDMLRIKDRKATERTLPYLEFDKGHSVTVGRLGFVAGNSQFAVESKGQLIEVQGKLKGRM